MAISSTTWEIDQDPANPRGSSALKLRETSALREAFREHNEDYAKELHRLIYHAEDESTRFHALQLAIEIGNGKAPQALSVELEDKTEPKPVIIEHVGMTQEQVDKTYPHETKARKERLEREANE